MSRIAVAGFIHETNTFSPLPTPYEAFAVPQGSWPGLIRGDSILQMILGQKLNICSAGFINRGHELGFEFIPLAYCTAEPSRQVSNNAFERIMGLICGGLADRLPVDGVYLDLHGAMVVEPFQDGETEIVRRVRAIVGESVPVVVSYDLHGNIAPHCFELADGMVGCRTYPHIDLYKTGERCANLMAHLLTGGAFYKAYRQIPYLIPISRQSTFTEPSRSVYALIEKLEDDPQVLSATVMMGFPPADIEDMGPAVFAYGVTQQAANSAVEQLVHILKVHEPDYALELLQPDEAVIKAMRLSQTAQKPVILADVQDNAGGGATSDTPWMLKALVRQDVGDAALGLIFDPEAAAAAHAAGAGNKVMLDVGGKLMPGQEPFRGVFEVKQLHDGPFPLSGPMGKGMVSNLGKMAHLQIGGVHVVVSSVRTQANDQAYFRVVGIQPEKMKILVLKSANHYRADFEPIASAIFNVEAPGAIVEDPSKAVYHNLRQGVRLSPAK